MVIKSVIEQRKRKKMVVVKVAEVGGGVRRERVPVGTRVGELFGELGPGVTIRVGREQVGLDRVLKDGDLVLVAPRILCGCNKVVRWKRKTKPIHTDVLRALNEYLGGSFQSLEYDHGLNQWLCFLEGNSARYPDKPRSFKVFWEEGGIRTSPHEQDEFTKAVADGFAALCEERWNTYRWKSGEGEE